MIRNYRKFVALPWSDRWLLIQAIVALPMSAWGVRRLGFSRWQTVLARLAPQRTGPEAGKEEVLQVARDTARLVRIAATRGFYSANCLQRSLVIWWLLRKQGFASHISFGARESEGGIQAHAWVECGDLVVSDRTDVGETFVPFQPPGTICRHE